MKKLSLLLLMACLLPWLAPDLNAQSVSVSARTRQQATVPRLEVVESVLVDRANEPTVPGKDNWHRFSKSFTMMAWYKITAFSTTGADYGNILIGHQQRCHANSNGSFLLGVLNDGHLKYSGKYCATTGETEHKNIGTFTDAAVVTKDEWFHLAFAYDLDNTRIDVYLNGEKVGEEVLAEPLTMFPDDPGIFTFAATGAGACVDDAAIYDKVLDAAAIQKAMADCTAGEPICLYTFDDVADATGAANLGSRDERCIFYNTSGQSQVDGNISCTYFTAAIPTLGEQRPAWAAPVETHTLTVNVTGNGSVLIKDADDTYYNSGDAIEATKDLTLLFVAEEGYQLASALLQGVDLVEAEFIEDGMWNVGQLSADMVLDVTFEEATVEVPDVNAEFVAFDFRRDIDNNINMDGCYGLTRYDSGTTGYTKNETLEGANGVTMKLLADEGYNQNGFRLQNDGLRVTKALTTGAIPMYCYIVLTAPEGKHFTKIVFKEENASMNFKAFGQNCALRSNVGEMNTTSETWTGAASEVALNFNHSTKGGLLDLVTVTLADGEGEAPKATTYTVTIEEPENGTIIVKNGDEAVENGAELEENTVLSIEATPAEGYELQSITVNGNNWADATVTLSRDLTIGAIFRELPPAEQPNMAVYVPVRTDGQSNSSYRLEVAENVIFDRNTASASDGWPIFDKDLTMMAWYKIDAFTNCTYNTGNVLMGHQPGAHVNYNGSFVITAQADGSLTIVAKNNFMDKNSVNAGIKAGEWFNLAVTYNHTSHTFKLFVDGEELYSESEPSQELLLFPDKPSVFTFGGNGAGAWVDEAAMFDVALSADEIETAMIQPGKLNPVAYYTFDKETAEGNGTFENLGSSDVPAIYGKRTGQGSSDGGIISSAALVANAASFGEGRVIVIPQDYCIPEGNAAHSDRYTRGGTFSGSNGASFTIAGAQTAPRQALYHDLTDQVLTFAPGETVTFHVDYVGEWMHNYVYIDFNKDGVFTPVLDGDVPAADSELVGYNYYRTRTGVETGYNNQGQICENAGKAYLEDIVFTLPASLKEGNYRLRFTTAWNSIDPCGYTDMSTNGACYIDVTLRVSKVAPRQILLAVNDAELGKVEFVSPEVEGVVANVAGDVTVKATAVDPDAYFVNWTNAEGNIVSSEAEFTYTGLTAASFTANFRRHYAVTVNTTDGGTIAINSLGGSISAGDYVDAGTEIIIRARAAQAHMLTSLKINDVERVQDYVEAGIYVTVNAPVAIDAVFEAAMWPIDITVEGNGRVVIATEMDEDTCEPISEPLTENISFADETEFYIIAIPAEGESVVALNVDGDNYVGEGSFEDWPDLFEHNGTYGLYWIILDRLPVSAVFTSNNAAIETIDADNLAGAEYFNLQGIRVAPENVTPGIYILRTANTARKVLVK